MGSARSSPIAGSTPRDLRLASCWRRSSNLRFAASRPAIIDPVYTLPLSFALAGGGLPGLALDGGEGARPLRRLVLTTLYAGIGLWQNERRRRSRRCGIGALGALPIETRA